MSASETEPSNTDLFNEIRDWRRELNGRVGKVEAGLAEFTQWRIEHLAREAERNAAVDQRIDRQTLDVVQEASGYLRTMFEDAVQSRLGESIEAQIDRNFEAAFQKMQSRLKAARQEEFREFFGNIHKSVVWVQPILTLLLGLLALSAWFFR